MQQCNINYSIKIIYNKIYEEEINKLINYVPAEITEMIIDGKTLANSKVI